MRLLVMVETDASNVLDLSSSQTSVIYADSPDDALSLLRHETFDLVLVGLTSSAEAGFRFIRAVRTAKFDVPLIALTGSQVADRTRALSLGAADAVSQPVDRAELCARFAAVYRRHKGLSHSFVQLGDLALSLETSEARFADVHIHLTSHEYAVLKLLVLRPGHIISKETFLNHLYGGTDEPDAKIIDVFVCKLRKKLSYVGCEGLIATFWGQGYGIRKATAPRKTPVGRTQDCYQPIAALPA
ncbi:response regulator transcription factor [Rhodopila sp.]|uniref:response regulator transcription factor n=1 Tax=Rhodopila sp. TaxID=2480087 RepID=UPI003D11D7F9